MAPAETTPAGSEVMSDASHICNCPCPTTVRVISHAATAVLAMLAVTFTTVLGPTSMQGKTGGNQRNDPEDKLTLMRWNANNPVAGPDMISPSLAPKISLSVSDPVPTGN